MPPVFAACSSFARISRQTQHLNFKYSEPLSGCLSLSEGMKIYQQPAGCRARGESVHGGKQALELSEAGHTSVHGGSNYWRMMRATAAALRWKGVHGHQAQVHAFQSWLFSA